MNLIKQIEYKTKKMIKKKENDDKGLGLASGPQVHSKPSSYT